MESWNPAEPQHDPPRFPQFLLDQDISYRVAEVARGLGLDIVSVYECGREHLSDLEQLRLAAMDRRLFVTRNRDDFIRWTVEFSRTAAAHAGVLIVPRTIPPQRPEPLAHALAHWTQAYGTELTAETLHAYFVAFLPAIKGPSHGL